MVKCIKCTQHAYNLPSVAEKTQKTSDVLMKQLHNEYNPHFGFRLNLLRPTPHHTGTQLFPAPPTCSVSLHGVPDVAVKVIVTSQQQTAGARESHGGDATDDVVMAVEAELLVCTQVKQPAGGVVGACGEGAAVGKELRRSTGRWMRSRKCGWL